MQINIKHYSICVSLAAFSVFGAQSSAEILFADDFESGGDLYTNQNKHSGGGFYMWMGGTLGGAPGDGTNDVYSYRNIIHDDSQDAKGAVIGSNYALKTHYAAGHAQDYQKNTVEVEFPESDDVYIRWYQKWSEDWVWPSGQQKYLKIRGLQNGVGSWSQNFMLQWGTDFHIVHNNYEDDNGTGWFMGYADRSVFPDTNVIREDDLNSGLGDNGGDGNFRYEKNRWYSIEIHVKGNTVTNGVANADGVNEMWVDGKLVYRHLLVNRGTEDKGLNRAEIQHVYQQSGNALTAHDQPTWMDNLVIATEYIGLDPNHPHVPLPPSDVSISP